MPEAGDDTATCTDTSLDVIFYMSETTLTILHVADVFCGILRISDAVVKGHTTVSQQRPSGGGRYVCESSNGEWLIFGNKVPTLGRSTAGPHPPLKPQRLVGDIVPCRHGAAAFLTVSGCAWSRAHLLLKPVGFGGVEMVGEAICSI